MAATVVQVYIGDRSNRDKICSRTLAGIEQGKRSDRIKDLMLKGLIYEGKDIPADLLDMRYMHRAVMENIPAVVTELDAMLANKPEQEVKQEVKPERTKVIVERSRLSTYRPMPFPKQPEAQEIPKHTPPPPQQVPDQEAVAAARSIVRDVFPAAFADKPDFGAVKVTRKQVSDDELERRL